MRSLWLILFLDFQMQDVISQSLEPNQPVVFYGCQVGDTVTQQINYFYDDGSPHSGCSPTLTLHSARNFTGWTTGYFSSGYSHPVIYKFYPRHPGQFITS